jgi:hypothetical protein
VLRFLPIAGFAIASLVSTGCAGTWDTITSRRFRQEPLKTTQHLIAPEDPMVVLRANPPRDGDEQAKAIRRLKEPLVEGLSQYEQDEVIDILARSAASDASPVLRLSAIETLGRFEDPRAPGILMIAYQKAHGRPDGVADPFETSPGIQLASASTGRIPGTSPLPLGSPKGFLPETADVIRCRTLEALGKTNRPEAARFLATIANGQASDAPEGADNRDVRLAAIRALSKCRQPESVVALAKVLAAESGKDTAMVGRAHDGLVRLTGKRLPPDPKEWNEVVQAGVVITPEPTWIEDAVQTAVGWVKP